MNRPLLIARVLWVFPAILLFLTINQSLVAIDLHDTLKRGEAVAARVVDVYKTDRVDVTIGKVTLEYPRSGGELVRRTLSMPISLIPQVEGRDSIQVFVNEGGDQEVVIAAVARPQWRMAAINAAISFMGLVLVTIAVFAWNRYLRRRGDPASRPTNSSGAPGTGDGEREAVVLNVDE